MWVFLQFLATLILAGVAITPSVPQGWRAFAVITLGIGLVTKIGEDSVSFSAIRDRIGIGWTAAIFVALAVSSAAVVVWAMGRSS